MILVSNNIIVSPASPREARRWAAIVSMMISSISIAIIIVLIIIIIMKIDNASY